MVRWWFFFVHWAESLHLLFFSQSFIHFLSLLRVFFVRSFVRLVVSLFLHLFALHYSFSPLIWYWLFHLLLNRFVSALFVRAHDRSTFTPYCFEARSFIRSIICYSSLSDSPPLPHFFFNPSCTDLLSPIYASSNIFTQYRLVVFNCCVNALQMNENLAVPLLLLLLSMMVVMLP